MQTVGAFAETFEAVIDNVAQVLQGKEDPTRLALVCLAAEGICSSRTCPGVGKTSLAKALARSFDLQWRRIQFTPDLLPSDVTGASVYDRDTGSFTFRPGGVFANVVLGDEINRASPKTQSALLEAMQEGQVTVDNVTHRLPDPFLVIATQNPVEHEGTYPLPESQLDRFLLRVRMGYPDRHAEMAMLDRPEIADRRGRPAARGRPRRHPDHGGPRQPGARGDGPQGLHRGPGHGHPQPPGLSLGHVPAGRPGAAAGRPGPGGVHRTRVRGPGRHQVPGRTGPGAPSGPFPRGRRHRRRHRRGGRRGAAHRARAHGRTGG